MTEQAVKVTKSHFTLPLYAMRRAAESGLFRPLPETIIFQKSVIFFKEFLC